MTFLAQLEVGRRPYQQAMNKAIQNLQQPKKKYKEILPRSSSFKAKGQILLCILLQLKSLSTELEILEYTIDVNEPLLVLFFRLLILTVEC
jgi:hypothetical protein